MARAIALASAHLNVEHQEWARRFAVYACAMSLIAAGRFLPL
jgi:hypothetical protein